MGIGARQMKLIALTGLPRSGKDTIADYLCERHGFLRRRFADPLKEAAAILLGRPLFEMQGERGFDREAILPEWGFTTRDFLQRFGTEAMRNNFGQDFWIRRMQNRLHGLNRVVITDCRFENEAAMVRSMGGIVVGVSRPGTVDSGHISDAPVVVDGMIVNGSTLHALYHQVEFILMGYNARARITRRSAPEQS